MRHAGDPGRHERHRGGLGGLAEAAAHHRRPNAVPDYANPEQMNRYDWYVNSNFTKPYPGDSKIYAPDQVPGVYLASADIGG